MDKENLTISNDAKKVLSLLCMGLKVSISFQQNNFSLMVDSVYNVPLDLLPRYQTAINELFEISK